jgi:hypothetical protein
MQEGDILLSDFHEPIEQDARHVRGDVRLKAEIVVGQSAPPVERQH